MSVSGKYLSPDMPANPCGLIAKSVFNDSFDIFKGNISLGEIEKLNTSKIGIAWETDI